MSVLKGVIIREAKGKASSALDGIRKALLRFEQYTKLKDFKTFNKEQAAGFKKYLTQLRTQRTDEPLSVSTLLATVNPLKDFFRGLFINQAINHKSICQILNI
ncbi:MAG: hypothetical protein K2Q34_05690 [Alphaproteobacteria bacterium]|nr:hypothetical protein [Alphaproteobacteria bacterium]